MANKNQLITQTIITPIIMAKIVAIIALRKLISCRAAIMMKHRIKPAISKMIPIAVLMQKKIIKNIIITQHAD